MKKIRKENNFKSYQNRLRLFSSEKLDPCCKWQFALQLWCQQFNSLCSVAATGSFPAGRFPLYGLQICDMHYIACTALNVFALYGMVFYDIAWYWHVIELYCMIFYCTMRATECGTSSFTSSMYPFGTGKMKLRFQDRLDFEGRECVLFVYTCPMK